MVEVFRRGGEVMSVAEQAIKIGAKVVWMREGVVNNRQPIWRWPLVWTW